MSQKFSRHGHAESEVALKGYDIVTSEAPNAAIIDAMSMAEYRRQFENHRQQNRAKAESSHHLKEYIKKKIDGMVDEACNECMLDVATVGVSVMTSTIVPFSGVAVVVAVTVTKCLTFAVTLGLIPALNVRSINVTAMMSQIQKSVEQEAKSGSMAAIETAILEILKKLGLDDCWLWEILKDILIEMIGEGASLGQRLDHDALASLVQVQDAPTSHPEDAPQTGRQGVRRSPHVDGDEHRADQMEAWDKLAQVTQTNVCIL